MKIRSIVKNPWAHIVLLIILMALIYSQSHIMHLDDSALYQKFTETLVNEWRADFSIPGFHGADFIAAIIYFFTKSEHSVFFLDIFLGVANVLLMFLAVREMLKGQVYVNSELAAIFSAYIYVLNPSEYTNALRGGHHTPLIFFALLGLYLLFKNSKWVFLPMGISYIIRPFPIVFFPFFIYKKKVKQLLLSLIIPAVYIIAECIQIQKIMIGVHESETVATLFSIKRFLMNMAYAFQNYFSFHNYTFVSPNYIGELAHLSPFIAFFALMAVLGYKKYFKNKNFFYALFFSALFGVMLPSSIYHLDMWYLWPLNFSLIALALPVIISLVRMIPIAALGFGYQFFYIFMASRGSYWDKDNFTLFYVFILIVFISCIYTIFNYKKNEDTFSM